jgi:hypothetical protein
LIFGNQSDALISSSYGTTLINCTLVGNSASGTTYGTIYQAESGDANENIIAWGNYPFDVGRGNYSNVLYGTRSVAEAPPTFVNSLSNVSPVFVDDYMTALATPSPANCGPTGFVLLATSLAGFKLQVTSPCIGAGTNRSWMVNAKDYGGNNRIYGDNVDMGAWEYTPESPPAGGARPFGLKAPGIFGVTGGVLKW